MNNTMKISTAVAHSNAIEGEPQEYDIHSRKAWLFLCEQYELTPEVVIHAHWLLAGHQLEPRGYKKGFRTSGVEISGRKGLGQNLVPRAIENWCKEFNPTLGGTFACIGRHIEFEHIHPFIDGNGRIGRLLMYWEMKQKMLPITYVHISERRQYYKIFGNNDDQRSKDIINAVMKYSLNNH